jgi:hypothetical protein
MRLVIISDLHSKVEHVGALRAACIGADALIICGDFTTFGDQAQVQSVADAVRVEGLPCYFVTGNCDAMPPDGTLDGCQNLHGRAVRFGDWVMAGICGSLPCPSHTPREFQEAFYARLLDQVKEACGSRTDRLILVSHQPPFGTAADQVPGGRHVGCQALRSFIDEVQPACCLTGHIHEAASRTRVGRTVLLNPGPFAQGKMAVLDL